MKMWKRWKLRRLPNARCMAEHLRPLYLRKLPIVRMLGSSVWGDGRQSDGITNLQKSRLVTMDGNGNWVVQFYFSGLLTYFEF